MKEATPFTEATVKHFKFLFFILPFLSFLACSDDDAQDNVPSELNPITVIADEQTRDILSSIDENSLTFTGTSSQIENISIGDILVSDFTDVAPYGFLRKVTAINKTGNETILTTEYAFIDEAVKNGSASYSEVLTMDDILSEDTSGEELRTTNSGFSFTVNETFDLDNNPATTQDRIGFSGQISIENPKPDFDIIIKNYAVEHFYTTFTFSNNLSLAVNYSHNIEQLGIQKTFVIKTIKLKPKTLSIPTPIGPFPIVLDQRLVFVAGLDGGVKAKLEGHINVNYTSELGIEYTKENGWTKISNHSNTQTGELEMGGEALLDGWIQLRYEIRPYSVSNIKIFAAAKVAARAEAEQNQTTGNTTTYDARLKVYADLTAKAQVQLFGQSLLNYEHQLWYGEHIIKEFCFKKIDDSIEECDDLLAGNWVMTHFHSSVPVGQYDFTYYSGCPGIWQWKTTYSGSANFSDGSGSLNHWKQVIVSGTDCPFTGYNETEYSNEQSSTALTYTKEGSVYTIHIPGDPPSNVVFLDENRIKIWNDFIYVRQ